MAAATDTPTTTAPNAGALALQPTTIEDWPATRRCDQDAAAQAWVRVRHPRIPGELAFCANHYRRQEPTLLGQGWVLVADGREHLEYGPSPSANAD